MRSLTVSVVRAITRLAVPLALVACASDGGDAASADATDDCVGRGCGGVSDGGDDAGGGGDAGPTGCTVDADCEAGVCDPTLGRCVAPCVDDGSCPATARCDVGGLCVPRDACSDAASCGASEACNTCLGVCQATAASTVCTSDVNCGFEEFCDTCIGRCLPRRELCDPCERDEECGESGDLCLEYASGGSWCGRRCGACPVGYACDEDLAQCVALSGSCERVRECDDSSDCPSGRVCSPAFLCVPGCTDDASCTAGNICQGGECRPPCTSAAECVAGAECVDGRCRVPGGCLTSEDCAEPETYCDRDTLMCVPGCEVDNDCLDAALECVAGDCVPRGCLGNYACAFGQVCDLATGLCAEAVGPYCDTCNGDDIDSCGTENLCASLQEDDVDVGSFCFVACTDDPDNACPQGYRCQEVEVEAGDVRRVCTRPCNREPV